MLLYVYVYMVFRGLFYVFSIASIFLSVLGTFYASIIYVFITGFARFTGDGSITGFVRVLFVSILAVGIAVVELALAVYYGVLMREVYLGLVTGTTIYAGFYALFTFSLVRVTAPYLNYNV